MSARNVNSAAAGGAGFAAMCRFLLGAVLSVAAVGLAGCGMIGPSLSGSGHVVSKDYDFTDFTKLTAAHAFQVEVTQGPKCQVTVSIDDNLVDRLDVSKSGGTLHIGMQANLSVRNATMRAKVVMPELTALELSGACQGNVTGFSSSQPLKVGLSGASRLHAEINSGDAAFDLSGASHAEVTGKGGKLHCEASGASHLDLERFVSGDTVAEASGASGIVVNAAGSLNASASGASSVRYVGKPSSVNSSASGASTVKPK